MPDKPLRALGVFNFAGQMTRGVQDAGYEVIATLEDGPFGGKTHRENFPNTAIHADVATWPVEELAEEGVDLMFGQPACFIAGTKVTTARGEIPIEDVVEGDMALTHRGNMRRVAKRYVKQHRGKLLVVTLQNDQTVTCTPDHEFWAARDTLTYPEWTRAEFLGETHLAYWRGRWISVKSVTPENRKRATNVYTLEVVDDHSYCVSGIAVKNCAGFSHLNSQRGVDNHNNGGLGKAIDTGLLIRPRAFVVESVSNLFKQGDPLVLDWEQRWQAAGYNTCRLVEQATHLGVPQLRKRALFVAAQANLDFGYDNPHHEPLTVQDAIGDLMTQAVIDDPRAVMPYATEPQTPYQAWARKGSTGVTWNVAAPLSPSLLALAPHIVPGKDARKVAEEIYEETYYKVRTAGTRADGKGKPGFLVRRLHWDYPSTTLAGGCHTMHPEFDRPLTIREKARLMGVPDSFIYGGNSRSNAYAETGKAVSPIVGHWVATQIARCLADPTGRVHQPAVDLSASLKKKTRSAAAKASADSLHKFVSTEYNP